MAGIGRAGYYNVGANISGPLTDTLHFRIGFEEFDTPSIQRNLGPDKDAGFATNNLYLEFQLDWNIGGFHIRNRATTFTYDNQPGYASRDTYQTGTLPVAPSATSPGALATGVFGGLAPNPQFDYSGPIPSEPYQINVDYTGFDRLRRNFQNITNADLDLGFATLFYVGGYQQYRATGSADLDQTSRASYDSAIAGPPNPDTGFFGFAPQQIVTNYRNNYFNNNNFYSHELKLQSDRNERLNYVVGVYYYNQSFDEQYWENIPAANAVLTTPLVAFPSATNPTPALSAPNPRLATFEQRNIYDIRSTAVFGNVTWDIAPTIRFDGGLRHTWDEKEAVTDFRFVYYYPPALAVDVSPAVSGAETFRRDKGLSGRATLAWRPNASDQLYISYQRGYLASAFTLGQGLPPDNVSDRATLDVYEVGGNVTRGTIRLDGSLFYQNLFGQQIPISTRGTITTPAGTAPGPIFTRFANADLSRIYGAETQVTWRPNISSNIVASYTYLNPTFRRFSGVIDLSEPATINGVANPLSGTPQDLSGNEIPRTPRHKATLYGYFGVPLGTAGYLYPGGSLSYQSSFYTTAFQLDRFRVPGRTIGGLTLTYRTPSENLDVTGSITNLFRNQYLDNYTIQSFDGEAARTVRSYGADRFWTVTARYRF